MARHLIGIVAIVLVAIAGVFYPFMPGRYDGLAVAISMMIQGATIVAAVLLTPIGLLWLIHEWRKSAVRLTTDAEHIGERDWAPTLGSAAIAASLVVALAAAAGAVEKMGFALAVIVLAVWMWIALRSLRAIRMWRKHGELAAIFHPAPLYLLLVPTIVVLVRFAFIERAVDWSRNRAMAASTAYIAAIELYRQTHGFFPPSLDSLHGDYERSGNEGGAYNVYFELFTTRLDTREFVAYNPLDQQQMTCHDADILEFSAEHLQRTRGYYAALGAGQPHWKRFLFD
jgi:hypothetical protein